MFTLELPTTPVARAAEQAMETDPDVTDGTVLAAALRRIADRIERDVRIVPQGPLSEWTDEVYRDASRHHGVLIGASFTFTRDAR